MRARVAEVAAVSALAVIVTAMMAGPVLLAPSERVFGREIVGRHHDPFTVMAQFRAPITLGGVYSQPITDITGALLARVSGPVAAYNWLVLLSFPLAAATAYLLARHLMLSPLGATIAAMAFAFSPFHVAQAAYHPHVAQVQWVPLFLLALWRCLDRASLTAVGLLMAATIAVTLSNLYAGLIAAVITPFALMAYWLVTWRADARSIRRLGITVATLVVIGASGIAYIYVAAGDLITNRAGFAFPRADLFRYSAEWWSYLLPPIGHPLLGAAAHRVWSFAGVDVGLLEQQVSLGWAIIALGMIGIACWAMSGKAPAGDRRSLTSLAYVPMLVILAIVALACSLSPDRTIGTVTVVSPSALLYSVAPMFRSYARFAVVVQLMAALLAGIGVDQLRRTTRRGQLAGGALVFLIFSEYVVSPSTQWREVLPTRAHHWAVQQVDRPRVLDCTPLDQESQSIQWLTGDRVRVLSDPISDCTEPNLPEKLAANGYTHLLVRRGTAAGRTLADDPETDGLQSVARFDDAQVFAVTAATPAVYTASMTGFSPRERDGKGTWRWMGEDAAWTVVNTRAHPIVATLSIELSAFDRPRTVDLLFDQRHVQSLVVARSGGIYRIGPLAVPPGDHELAFHPMERPTIADEVLRNGDARALSLSFGRWHWTIHGERP